MKFEHQYDSGSAKVTIEVPKDADIHEVMAAFHNFLICCTYHPRSIQRGLADLVASLEDLEDSKKDE